MTIEQQPDERVLGLQDGLSLGIEDLLKRDPKSLDLFFLGSDGLLHITSDLSRNLKDTLGVALSEPLPEDKQQRQREEQARDWAIRRFLARHSPFDLLAKEEGGDSSPFEPFGGYVFKTERRRYNPDGDSTLYIATVHK